jgi:hypothetical protein
VMFAVNVSVGLLLFVAYLMRAGDAKE